MNATKEWLETHVIVEPSKIKNHNPETDRLNFRMYFHTTKRNCIKFKGFLWKESVETLRRRLYGVDYDKVTRVHNKCDFEENYIKLEVFDKKTPTIAEKFYTNDVFLIFEIFGWDGHNLINEYFEYTDNNGKMHRVQSKTNSYYWIQNKKQEEEEDINDFNENHNTIGEPGNLDPNYEPNYDDVEVEI